MIMGKMKMEIALIVGIVFFCCWCAYIIIKMIMTQENPHHHQHENNHLPNNHHQPYQPLQPYNLDHLQHQPFQHHPSSLQNNNNNFRMPIINQDYITTKANPAYFTSPTNNIAQQIKNQHQQNQLHSMTHSSEFRPMSFHQQPATSLANILSNSQQQQHQQQQHRLAEATSPRWHAVLPAAQANFPTRFPNQLNLLRQNQVGRPNLQNINFQQHALYPAKTNHIALESVHATNQQPIRTWNNSPFSNTEIKQIEPPAIEPESDQEVDGQTAIDYQNDPNPDDQVNNNNNPGESPDQDLANVVEEDDQESAPHEDQNERRGRRSFSESEEEANERDANGRPIISHRNHLINGKPVADTEPENGDEDHIPSTGQKFDKIVDEIEQNEPHTTPDYDESEASDASPTDQQAGGAGNNVENSPETEGGESRLNKVVARTTGQLKHINRNSTLNPKFQAREKKLQRKGLSKNKNPRLKVPKLEEVGEKTGDSEPERKREKHNHKLKETLTSKQWDDSTGNEPSSESDSGVEQDGTAHEESPEVTREKMEIESKDDNVEFVDMDQMAESDDFPFMSSDPFGGGGSAKKAARRRKKRDLSASETASLGPILANVIDRIENATRKNGVNSTGMVDGVADLLEANVPANGQSTISSNDEHPSSGGQEDHVEVELMAPPSEEDPKSLGVDNQMNDRDALEAAGFNLEQLDKRQDYTTNNLQQQPTYLQVNHNQPYPQHQQANYATMGVMQPTYNYTLMPTGSGDQVRYVYQQNSTQQNGYAFPPPAAASATIGLTVDPAVNQSSSMASNGQLAALDNFYSTQPEPEAAPFGYTLDDATVNNQQQQQPQQQQQYYRQQKEIPSGYIAPQSPPADSTNLLPPEQQQFHHNSDVYPPPPVQEYYQLTYPTSQNNAQKHIHSGQNQQISPNFNQQFAGHQNFVSGNPMSLGSKAYSHKKKKKKKKLTKEEISKKKFKKKKKKKGSVKVAKSSKGKSYKKKMAAQKGSMKKRKQKAGKKMSKGYKEFKGATKGHKAKKGLGARGNKKGTLLFKDKGYKKRGFKKAYQKLESGDHKTYFDEFRDKDHKKKWKNFKDKHQFSQNKKWAAKDKKRYDHHKLDEMKDKKTKTGAWNKNALSKDRKDYKYKGSMQKKLLNKKKKKKKKIHKKKKKSQDVNYEVGIHMKG